MIPKKSFYTEKYKNLPNSLKKPNNIISYELVEIFQSGRQLLEKNYQNKLIDLEKSELQEH